MPSSQLSAVAAARCNPYDDSVSIAVVHDDCLESSSEPTFEVATVHQGGRNPIHTDNQSVDPAAAAVAATVVCMPSVEQTSTTMARVLETSSAVGHRAGSSCCCCCCRSNVDNVKLIMAIVVVLMVAGAALGWAFAPSRLTY